MVRFIEDNWLHRVRLGGGSFDATAGSLEGLFDFGPREPAAKLFLDPKTGAILTAPPADSAN